MPLCTAVPQYTHSLEEHIKKLDLLFAFNTVKKKNHLRDIGAK